MRCLDPDRVRRPTMADLVTTLADPSVALPTTDNEPHTVRLAKRPSASDVEPRATTAEELAQLPRRRWWPIGVAAVAVVGVAIGIVVATRRDATPSEPPVTEPSRDVTNAPPADPPPVAEVVEVAVSTTPPGAEIYVGDESAPRGITPLTVRLRKGSGVVAIRLALDGFAELRRSVDTLSDGTLDEKLARAAAPTKPRPSGRTRPRDPVVRAPPPRDAGVAPVDAAPAGSDGGLGTNLISPRRR